MAQASCDGSGEEEQAEQEEARRWDAMGFSASTCLDNTSQPLTSQQSVPVPQLQVPALRAAQALQGAEKEEQAGSERAGHEQGGARRAFPEGGLPELVQTPRLPRATHAHARVSDTTPLHSIALAPAATASCSAQGRLLTPVRAGALGSAESAERARQGRGGGVRGVRGGVRREATPRASRQVPAGRRKQVPGAFDSGEQDDWQDESAESPDSEAYEDGHGIGSRESALGMDCRDSDVSSSDSDELLL